MAEVLHEGSVLPVGNTVQPYKALFSLVLGVPRVDDLRDHLRHSEWPAMEGCTREYGPHKTLSNRFVRWSRLGLFSCIFAELADKEETPDR